MGITKLDWLKTHRVLLIVVTIAFVVVLFSFKSSSTFTNRGQNDDGSEGLVYNTTILEDLVKKDTDGDGILDWEEGLWGTNPNKKDTDDDGTPDSVEIAKIKNERGENTTGSSSVGGSEENLTQTDRFSRELVATMAALSQTGEMDQATIEQLGASLALQIENSINKKIYTAAEIKIVNDNSAQAVAKYVAQMEALEKKYPVKGNATQILQESITAEGEIDGSVLVQFDPMVKQMKNILNEITKMDVPQKLAPLHLQFVNAVQIVMENLSDLQLAESDVILAFSAISQYEGNVNALESAMTNLKNAVGN